MAITDYASIEKFLLNQIGLFTKDATGIGKMFLLDSEWPKILDPAIGTQCLTFDDDGWGMDDGYTTDEKMKNTVTFKVAVEFIAVRGTPLSTLTQLNHALRGFKALRYKYFNSQNIGFLDCTNPTRADTVLDGLSFEKRARMTAFFQLAVQDIDPIATTTIDTIYVNSSTIHVGSTVPITEEYGVDQTGLIVPLGN